jgi:hypothetical protein
MCNSWSHKYETLFERVGLAKELIFSPDETRVDSIDALVWKFEAAWSRRQDISAALMKELPALKREVGRFFDEALATTS